MASASKLLKRALTDFSMAFTILRLRFSSIACWIFIIFSRVSGERLLGLHFINEILIVFCDIIHFFREFFLVG